MLFRSRPPITLLLILQLLAAGALALALARPAREGPISRHLAIVLDASASMQSTDTPPSRFDVAIGAIRERLTDHMQTAKERLADTREVVVDKTKQAARATDDYVRDNPWHAVGIAAGVGLVIGMLIGRR